MDPYECVNDFNEMQKMIFRKFRPGFCHAHWWESRILHSIYGNSVHTYVLEAAQSFKVGTEKWYYTYSTLYSVIHYVAEAIFLREPLFAWLARQMHATHMECNTFDSYRWV